MLTARGRLTIGVGLAAGLAGRVLGLPELFGLAAAAVLVTCAALVQVHATRVELAVTARAVPPVVRVGEAARLELSLETSGARRLTGCLQLVSERPRASGWCQPDRILVPETCRGWRGAVGFELPTDRRGIVEAGDYEVALTDPLGLARRRLGASGRARCVVLPSTEFLPAVLPAGLGQFTSGGAGPFSGWPSSGEWLLREYGAGDDMRLVHWPTTARVGRLMVRHADARSARDGFPVAVLLDPGDGGIDPLVSEKAVEIAASVLAAAEARGEQSFRLVTTAGVDSGALSGPADLLEALVTLAGVQSGGGQAEDRFAGVIGPLLAPAGDEAVVVVCCVGQVAPPLLLERLASGRAVVVLVVVGATPEPSEDAPTSSPTDDIVPLRRRGQRLYELTVAPGSSLPRAWGTEESFGAPAREGAISSGRSGAGL